MCGRFTLRTPVADLVERFDLKPTEVQLPLRFNVAPTQDIAVVRQDREHQHRELVLMRWGLIPFWADEPSIGNRMINARAESVAEKPAFRHAIRRRRCLVLADGYLEWVAQGKQKQPYLIRMPDDRSFAMAGLWERWNEGLESCTIITTSSNRATRHLHDRMPVILEPEDYDRWLDRGQEDPNEIVSLLTPYEIEPLKVDPVSTRVNNVRHDDPACLTIQRELF